MKKLFYLLFGSKVTRVKIQVGGVYREFIYIQRFVCHVFTNLVETARTLCLKILYLTLLDNDVVFLMVTQAAGKLKMGDSKESLEKSNVKPGSDFNRGPY